MGDDWIGIKLFAVWVKDLKRARERKGDHFVSTSSETRLDFHNFGRNQPSNGAGKDCVRSLNGQWHNDHCNRKHTFICEFP